VLLSNLNLLIVDEEDPASGKALTKNLIKAGFTASFLSSGEQALKELKKQKIDLLITGIKSSKIDGLELLRRIKASNYPIDVIIYTKFGDVDNYIRATKLGAADFINKPMEFNEFLSIITATLHGKTQKTKIATTDRRKHPRFSVDEPAYIFEKQEIQKKKTKILAKIIDISLSGMLLEHHSSFEVGKSLEIHPILAGRKIITSGRVRRSQEKEHLDNPTYHTGIELTRISNHNQRVLVSYLETI